MNLILGFYLITDSAFSFSIPPGIDASTRYTLGEKAPISRIWQCNTQRLTRDYTRVLSYLRTFPRPPSPRPAQSEPTHGQFEPPGNQQGIHDQRTKYTQEEMATLEASQEEPPRLLHSEREDLSDTRPKAMLTTERTRHNLSTRRINRISKATTFKNLPRNLGTR